MDPTIDLEDTWAERLASDLRLIRAVRGGEITNPTPIRVEIDDALDLSVAQTTAALLNLSRRTRIPMRATPDRDEGALTVELGPTRMRASLPLQVASCSLHVAAGLLDDADPQAVAELALMLCAGAVAPANEDCARHWLRRVRPEAPWWAIPELGDRLLQVLAHPDSVDMLLSIHATLVEADDASADYYMIPVLDMANEAGETAFNAYSQRVRSHLPNNWDGGRMAFNLSNLHRLRRDFQTALELLEITAAKAPLYRDDSRYQNDLAACLWEVGRFEESADAYQRALELGADAHRVLPLLADSLMYAGHYRKALTTLDPWMPNGTAADKAGHLRRVILNHVIDYVGVRDQDRTAFDTDAATKSYRDASEAGNLTEDTLLALLRETDALHPRLWIHLVAIDGEHVNFEAALVSAFMMVNEPFSWVFAMVGAIQQDVDDAVLRAVIDQARYLCKDDFYDAALQFANEQDKEEGEFLRELVGAAFSAEPEAFTNDVRALDPSRADWVIDTISYPVPPGDGLFDG